MHKYRDGGVPPDAGLPDAGGGGGSGGPGPVDGGSGGPGPVDGGSGGPGPVDSGGGDADQDAGAGGPDAGGGDADADAGAGDADDGGVDVDADADAGATDAGAGDADADAGGGGGGGGGGPSGSQTGPNGNASVYTGMDWFKWLGQHFNAEVQGSVKQTVYGNSEEYVRGFKNCTVIGGVQDLYLSHKHEAIYGLESKFVAGLLAESFLGAKCETAVSVAFESDGGRKNHLAPSGDKKKNAAHVERMNDIGEIVGKLTETCASSRLRATSGNEKITKLVENVASLTANITSAFESIKSFDASYGNVTWKADGWTEAIKGQFKTEAGTFTAKSDGAATIKGSTVFVKGGSGALIVCRSGEVKINKKLLVK